MLRAAKSTLSHEQRQQTISAYQDEVGRRVRSVIEQGIDDGEYAPARDLDLTVDLLTGVVDVALDRVIDEPANVEAITASVVAFLQGALGRRDNP
ncbi:hypothetical protein J2T10_001775 [Paenarthrobacter nicotinovorans]|uniref:TetR family transcriptional regulator n=2 Tax=Paenarthrobacter nicotinovorans TaxID=29320 RepID=A0ABT9TKG2_PAENI|nr:hypothetical protein [Paenarthrobacter nicotinovorans]MDQ0102129.1 hypothetical protein [Paenarthrobacter nicotinovorans]GAT88003.1 hypothetical protein CVCC1112_2663 [Paenarthrobacter nicotinovorans]